jgi:hypothetical protein
MTRDETKVLYCVLANQLEIMMTLAMMSATLVTDTTYSRRIVTRVNHTRNLLEEIGEP